MPTAMPEKGLVEGPGWRHPSARLWKQADWLAFAIERFGSWLKVAFVCPACGHVQSTESLVAHGDTRDKNDIINSLYQSCEGRRNEMHGCDYTINGLLTLGDDFVLGDEPGAKVQRVFSFAEPDQVPTEGPRQGLQPSEKYRAHVRAAIDLGIPIPTEPKRK